MAVQLARNAVAFKTTLALLVDRLRDSLTQGTGDDEETVHADFVRATVVPDDAAEYRAEPGVTIRVSAPQPASESGAGRAGYQVRRVLYVQVVTTCLLDRAGSDEVAMARHFDLEEQVVDALLDTPPVGTPSSVKAGNRVKWVPGSEEAQRPVRVDEGTVKSTLVFDITYPAPVYVDRD